MARMGQSSEKRRLFSFFQISNIGANSLAFFAGRAGIPYGKGGRKKDRESKGGLLEKIVMGTIRV
jgi:hypothetical protein